jgi:hypothetical protein
MIHCSRSMPTGNLDEPVTANNPPTVPPSAFRLPCEYYSAPLAEVRPIFPKWVPYGCGTASAIILLLLFAGGAIVTGPRLASLMDLVLGTSLGELKSMYTPEVTTAQKQRFDDEVKQLRDALRHDKVPMKNLQPFLRTMQTAISDKKVTPDEVERLITAAAEARSNPKQVTGNR